MAKSKKRKCVCGINYVMEGHNYCIACESARDPVRGATFDEIDKATKNKKPKRSQIIFAFKNRISKQKRVRILEEIRLWEDVKSVERVFDDSESDTSSVELYVAYAKKGSQINFVLNKLQSLVEIKYAYLPPGRSPK